MEIVYFKTYLEVKKMHIKIQKWTLNLQKVQQKDGRAEVVLVSLEKTKESIECEPQIKQKLHRSQNF